MPILLRIAKHMPVKGFLAECGGKAKWFATLQEAQNWIYSQPGYLRCDANEMPSISFGFYRQVIMRIP